MSRVRAILLAAGKGTRMKSERPKVLHEVCGRPMLWYVLRALQGAGIEDILVVTSDELDPHVASLGVRSVVQAQQLGTGHAVQVALSALETLAGGRILIASGDMPLVPAELFARVLERLDDRTASPALAFATARMPLPSNFGRVLRRGNALERIVEVRDASADELAVDEMNAAIYAFDEERLRDAVAHLQCDNAQGEYYLTDTVKHLTQSGQRVTPVLCDDYLQVLGINDRVELAIARRKMNERLCAQHMRDGVTIIDPATTYLEPELVIGQDTIIYPNTSIGRLSQIGKSSTIGPNARLSMAKLGDRVTVRDSVIVESMVGSDVTIGPFAHLRGNTCLADGVSIGNFVEVKKSQLARGVKASHLSYLGDATIGENTNVGAGTITCNYDGTQKHPTTIGRDAFIGSNSALVAPVTIGDGALVGAGAVVTKDVAAGDRVVGNPARSIGR
ncbi:MAG: bifunctional UDP-N-acetylglucosamine diphosphorylase/glucosamine-1-phosphate N-acetyltransferase GlmU [Vulcanimicrobiaceae bacterium]